MDSRLSSMIPLKDLDEGTNEQIKQALQNDFLKALAIMPDAHQGYDLPIGGVALLDKMISPSYVGYDIGCGMCFVETNITKHQFDKEKHKQKIYKQLLEEIPVGFSSHTKPMPLLMADFDILTPKINSEINKKMQEQIGTLGGGNHFIEIGYNRKNNICVTIHSGSRKAGWLIGKHFMSQGRFFPLNSELGQWYYNSMEHMTQYAFLNRETMMKKVLKILGSSLKEIHNFMINEHHNYAEVTHQGVLHRKGATAAKLNQPGLIPINMLEGTYITKGLGNKTFLESASHGAGRIKGRKEAKRTLSLDYFKEQMQGILTKVSKNTLDEAPGAYKKAELVIGLQEGIVIEVQDKTTPLIVVKG